MIWYKTERGSLVGCIIVSEAVLPSRFSRKEKPSSVCALMPMLMSERYSMTSSSYFLRSHLCGSGLIRYGVSSTPLSGAEICAAFCPALFVGRSVYFWALVLLAAFCDDVLRRNVLCSSQHCLWAPGPSNTGIVFGRSGPASTSISCPPT